MGLRELWDVLNTWYCVHKWVYAVFHFSFCLNWLSNTQQNNRKDAYIQKILRLTIQPVKLILLCILLAAHSPVLWFCITLALQLLYLKCAVSCLLFFYLAGPIFLLVPLFAKLHLSVLDWLAASFEAARSWIRVAADSTKGKNTTSLQLATDRVSWFCILLSLYSMPIATESLPPS